MHDHAMNPDPATSDSARSQRALIDAAWEQVQKVRSVRAGTVTSGGRVSRVRRGPLPDSLPGYRMVEEIHRGGQGVVFKAVQESTARMVAVKFMHGGLLAGPRERARFEREVQILAQLKHPNIVTVHDSGEVDGAAWFVMDYIEGAPLDEYVAAQNPSLQDRLRLFGTICEAVNVAHLRGVIHRDLKPRNIRIDPGGQPRSRATLTRRNECTPRRLWCSGP